MRTLNGWTLAAAALIVLTAGRAAAVGSRALARHWNGNTERWSLIAPTDLHGSGSEDALVACVDESSSGWVVAWGSEAGDTPQAHAVDRHGDLYVVGTTMSAANVTRTSGEPLASPLEMGFLLKLSSAGELRWARTYSWSYHHVVFNDLALDRSGDIVVVGSAKRIRPGLSDVDYERAFVLRCDGNGEPRWALQSEFTTLGSLAGVDVDDEGVAHAVGQTEHPTSGENSVSRTLLVGISADGTVRYCRSYGDGAGDWGRAVLVHGPCVYIGGRRAMGSYPDPKLGGDVSHPNTGAVLLRADRSGTIRWANTYGGPMGDGTEGLAIGPKDGIVGFGFATTGFWQGAPVAGENREAFLFGADADGKDPCFSLIGSGSAVADAADLGECFQGISTNRNGRMIMFGVLATNAALMSATDLDCGALGGQSTPLQGDWKRAACSSSEADPARFHFKPLTFEDCARALEARHLQMLDGELQDSASPGTSYRQSDGSESAPAPGQLQVVDSGVPAPKAGPGRKEKDPAPTRVPLANAAIARMSIVRLPGHVPSRSREATKTSGNDGIHPAPAGDARQTTGMTGTKSATPPAAAESSATQGVGPAQAAPDGAASTLTLNGAVFNAGQRIAVRIAHPPTNRFAWIGFYRAEAGHRDYIKYNFLSNLDGLQYEDVLAPEEKGRYNFRVFRDESFQPVTVSGTLEVR